MPDRITRCFHVSLSMNSGNADWSPCGEFEVVGPERFLHGPFVHGRCGIRSRESGPEKYGEDYRIGNMSLLDSINMHAFLQRERPLPVSACDHHHAFAVPKECRYFPAVQIIEARRRFLTLHARSGIESLADRNEPLCLGIMTKAPCLTGELSGAVHSFFKVQSIGRPEST